VGQVRSFLDIDSSLRFVLKGPGHFSFNRLPPQAAASGRVTPYNSSKFVNNRRHQDPLERSNRLLRGIKPRKVLILISENCTNAAEAPMCQNGMCLPPSRWIIPVSFYPPFFLRCIQLLATSEDEPCSLSSILDLFRLSPIGPPSCL